MYIVHVKRYTAARARQAFSHLLDAAEKGEAVVIERRGVRFRVGVEAARGRESRGRVRIAILDPAVEDGHWTWELAPGGLEFRRRRGRR